MGTTREGLGEDVCKSSASQEERAIEEERVERQEMRPLPREKPYPSENALGRLPVLGSVFASADKARQDTDRVGEVGASAHHGVHQGPDQLSVRTGGGTVGGVNEKTPGGLCNFSNTSFCHAILLRGVREGVSVVNTMGGEIGREMVIEEFTAAIGMEAANGTTE
ncbi:hypothetical protein CLOP_g12872 [Closterium sp. NIES-67]|nr:hypothetical protein CLOP_g12872 [Closterium sp. NIES-67]